MMDEQGVDEENRRFGQAISNENLNDSVVIPKATRVPPFTENEATQAMHLRSRVDLGSASSYYFKHLPKTPLQKEVDERRRLNASMNTSMRDKSMLEDQSVDFNLEAKFAGADETQNDAEISFVSVAASTDSSSSGLNRSILSDTTELTASNFVLRATLHNKLRKISIGTNLTPSVQTKKHTSPMKKDISPMRSPLAPLNSNRRNSLLPGDLARHMQSATDPSNASKPDQSKKVENLSSHKNVDSSLNGRNSEVDPKWREVVENIVNLRKKRQHELEATDQKRARHSLRRSTDSVENQAPINLEETYLELPAKFDQRIEFERTSSEKSLGSVASDASPDVSRRSLEELLDGISGGEHEDAETSSVATSMSFDAPSIPSVSTPLSSHSSSMAKATTSSSSSLATDVLVTGGHGDRESLPAEILVQENYSVEPSSSKKSDEKPQTPPFRYERSPKRKSLTPSRIRAPPVRMLHPDLKDSPARNTRSAKSRRQSVLINAVEAQMEREATDEEIQSSALETDESPSHNVLMSNSRNSPVIQNESFEGRQSGLLGSIGEIVEVGSPVRTHNLGKSPSAETLSTRKKLTPSRIRDPPVRMPNPDVMDSPARNTRSAKSRRQSVLMDTNEPKQDELVLQSKANDAVETVDSPATNTLRAMWQESQASQLDHRVVKNRKSESGNDANLVERLNPTLNADILDAQARNQPGSEVSHLFPQERKSHLEAVNDCDMPTSAARARRQSLSSSSRILNSSLRKPGARAVNHSARKKVAFGSPDIVEFNSSSPSMNLTPASFRHNMFLVEDTVEIEADMSALLHAVQCNPRSNGNAVNAGRTPMPSRTNHVDELKEGNDSVILQNGTIVEGSNSWLVSRSPIDRDASPGSVTKQLEHNLEQVVVSALSKYSCVHEGTWEVQNPSDALDDAEKTVALEVDMTTLLDTVSAPASVHAEGDFTSSQFGIVEDSSLLGDKSTVELEENIQEVLQAARPPVFADSDAAKDDSDMDEENTVELEEDFQSFLKASAKVESEDVDFGLAQDSPGTSQSGSRRRSSLSSQRFSLVPEGNASISHGGLDMEIEDRLDEDELPMSVSEREVEFDLLGTEVLSAVLNSDWPDQASDLLLRFSCAVKETDFSAVTSTLNEVFELVCQHLHAVPEVELNSLLTVPENDTWNCIQLQNKIRSKNDEDFLRNLGVVLSTVQSLENHNWQGWLISVIESLREPLEELHREVAERSVTLDNYAYKIGLTKAAVSSVTSKEVSRARLKSYHDRQIDIAKLDADMTELEAELRNEEKSLRDELATLTSCEILTNEHMKNISLKKDENSLRLGTESAERCYYSLIGMSNTKPVDVDWKTLSFVYEGMLQHTSVVTTFDVTGVHGVIHDISADSNINARKHHEKLRAYKCVRGFAQARIEQVNRIHSREMPLRAKDMSIMLRKVEWFAGRVEMVATELLNLSRRYRATLIEKNGSYELEVDFGQKQEQTTLRATFEIPLCYPFAPINVCLDSFEHGVDVDSIRKLLLKNAKPGFGYLSRTCDVIATQLRISKS